MNIKYYFLLACLFALTSCAHSAPKVTPSAKSEVIDFEAQVVDPSCVLKGNLVMEPFKPGEGVSADAQVSQASLTMVKGFAEAMKETPSGLNLIIDEKTDKANFFIKGYITKYDRPQGLINRVKKKRNVFAVEGKIINLETNRVIVRFSSSVQSFHEKNLNDFALMVGQRLARYLLGQDKELP